MVLTKQLALAMVVHYQNAVTPQKMLPGYYASRLDSELAGIISIQELNNAKLIMLPGIV